MATTSGAYIDADVEIAGSKAGILSGLTFAVKDMYDVGPIPPSPSFPCKDPHMLWKLHKTNSPTNDSYGSALLAIGMYLLLTICGTLKIVIKRETSALGWQF